MGLLAEELGLEMVAGEVDIEAMLASESESDESVNDGGFIGFLFLFLIRFWLLDKGRGVTWRLFPEVAG